MNEAPRRPVNEAARTGGPRSPPTARCTCAACTCRGAGVLARFRRPTSPGGAANRLGSRARAAHGEDVGPSRRANVSFQPTSPAYIDGVRVAAGRTSIANLSVTSHAPTPRGCTTSTAGASRRPSFVADGGRPQRRQAARRLWPRTRRSRRHHRRLCRDPGRNRPRRRASTAARSSPADRLPATRHLRPLRAAPAAARRRPCRRRTPPDTPCRIGRLRRPWRPSACAGRRARIPPACDRGRRAAPNCTLAHRHHRMERAQQRLRPQVGGALGHRAPVSRATLVALRLAPRRWLWHLGPIDAGAVARHIECALSWFTFYLEDCCRTRVINGVDVGPRLLGRLPRRAAARRLPPPARPDAGGDDGAIRFYHLNCEHGTGDAICELIGCVASRSSASRRRAMGSPRSCAARAACASQGRAAAAGQTSPRAAAATFVFENTSAVTFANLADQGDACADGAARPRQRV